MLKLKKGANFKLFKTVCLNGSTAEIMTSGWANVAEQISYTHTKTRETDSENTRTNHKIMIQYLQKTIIWTAFSLVWVLLLQTGRIWNKSAVKILPMTSLSRRKSITNCENVITFHHDKNHHNSLHFPRWFSPFIFVERTGIWVGDHFLESIGKIHIILLAFFDPSKVWSPGPESTR